MVDRLRSVNRRRTSEEHAAEPTLREYIKVQLSPSRLWPVPIAATIILLWGFTADQIEVILALIVALSAIIALLFFLVQRGGR
jgi:hypothetical protein